MDGDRAEPRVLVVTVNEYYYIPRFLGRVLDSEKFDIVGIVTVPPSLGTENMIAFLRRLVRVFGLRVFLQHAAFYAKYLVLDLLNRWTGIGQPYAPTTLADQYSVPHRHVDDVNALSTKEYIRSKDPDILVSVAATQRFDDELLEIPSNCAINVHSSLLPDYRGVSPGFWNLLNDEEVTGITVHFMDDSLDTGDVILQESLAIAELDTLHTLNTRVADRGSAALLKALEAIREGTVDPTPINPDDGAYFSMPTREDVRAFLRAGNRFF